MPLIKEAPYIRLSGTFFKTKPNLKFSSKILLLKVDRLFNTGVAQLVEHWSPKPGVGSSSLSTRA